MENEWHSEKFQRSVLRWQTAVDEDKAFLRDRIIQVCNVMECAGDWDSLLKHQPEEFGKLDEIVPKLIIIGYYEVMKLVAEECGYDA